MFVYRLMIVLLFVMALPSKAISQFDNNWLIVIEDNAPSPISENAAALRNELSDLCKKPVEVVTCSSLAEQDSQDANLIVVGRYNKNSCAKPVLAKHSATTDLLQETSLTKQQGYLLIVDVDEQTKKKTIVSVGEDVLGAVYGISHLRTHFRRNDAGVYLDTDFKSPRVYSPSFPERGVYYNLAWEHMGRQTPLNWDDEQWEYWIDRLICAQLTHVYFCLWSDHLYYPGTPDTGGEDDRLRHQHLQHMIRYAHRRGMKVGYLFTPTTVPRSIFKANSENLKASISYVDHGFPVVCSAATAKIEFGDKTWDNAWQLITELYSRQIELFSEADLFQLWLYDPGGCFCGPDKFNCREHQATRAMQQVDYFCQVARQANPDCDFEVSLWPVWALEPAYEVDYQDELLDLLARYANSNSKQGRPIRISDTLQGNENALPGAQKLGMKANGFIFPTNVESGCSLLNPMLAFLSETVRNGSKYNLQSIHHMRIEEPMKYANTYLASRFYWQVEVPPEDALRSYVSWVANTDAEAADHLYEALSLLERFMCDGKEEQDHAKNGQRIQEHVDSALTLLGAEKAEELEWLRTTARAVRIIGLAIEEPMRNDSLSKQFSELMSTSPTFSTSTAHLDKYVAWISKGWSKENF